MNIRSIIGHFIERRKENKPVSRERRKMTMKDADQALHDAQEHLDRTVRLRKEDLLPPKREVANDIQQTVQFATFREICNCSGSHEFALRLCRHRAHPAANIGAPICDEELCPIMRGITA